VISIETPQGECRVAITRCVQQGNAHAQNAAVELLSDLKPAFVFVVGIAGGIPSPDFCLGDVAVSDYIQDLTLEDTGVAPGSRRFNALGGPLHPSASRIVERLRAVERAGSSWSDTATIGVQRPGLDGQYTTDDEAWNADISGALARHAERSAPIATAKKIASSDRLIKDPELLKTWRTVLKAVSAVEMESAGVYLPCQRNNVPVLAIRGISDIVGWKRHEAWTLYACHTAAAFTRMLIGAGVFCTENSLATRNSS
jgi:nucleoside phosphorylase